MKRSLVSLSPLFSSTTLLAKTTRHAIWLAPRLRTSLQLSTLRLGASAVHTPLRLPQPPTFVSGEQSIWKFVSSKINRATHRSGINRNSGPRGGHGGGGGGSHGPWDNLRDRVNSIPQNVIFWGIMGLNGIVFVSWNLAWMKYVCHNSRCTLRQTHLTLSEGFHSKARMTHLRTYG